MVADPTRLPRTRALLACVVTLTALQALLFVGYVRGWDTKLVGDEPGYYKLASNILQGHGMSESVPPHTALLLRTPGYPAFLSLLVLVSGGSVVLIRILQFGLLVGISLLLARLIAQFWDRKHAALGALLCASYLVFGQFAGMVMTEILATLLVTALMLLTTRLQRPASWLLYGLGGALCGLLALVRPSMAPLILGLLLSCAIAHRGIFRRATILGAVCICVGFGAMVGPWMLRNRVVAGRWMVATGGGLSLYLSAQQYARGYTYKLLAPEFEHFRVDAHRRYARARRQPEDTPLVDMPPVEAQLIVDDQYGDEARRLRAQVPWHRMVLDVVPRAAYLWSSSCFVVRADFPIFERLMKAQHYLFLALAALGICLRRRHVQAEWPLWFPLVLVTAFHLVFHVEARYTMAVRPLMLAYAAAGLASLLAVRSRRSAVRA